MLKWLGKHNYTLNMFHDECENCSIIAMVLREMDDWVRHALLRRTGVIICGKDPRLVTGPAPISQEHWCRQVDKPVPGSP